MVELTAPMLVIHRDKYVVMPCEGEDCPPGALHPEKIMEVFADPANTYQPGTPENFYLVTEAEVEWLEDGRIVSESSQFRSRLVPASVLFTVLTKEEVDRAADEG